MFGIFITSVALTFVVFSLLFAYALHDTFPRIDSKYIYLKVLLCNAALLACLYISKIIPTFVPLIWLLQQVIIAVFVGEIFAALLKAVCWAAVKLYGKVIGSTKSVAVNKSRRVFLYKAALLPLSGAVLYGSFIEKNDIILNQYDIPVKNFDVLRGFKIAHLTDAHMGSFFSLEKLRYILDRLVKLSPDILAVTGDIFDDDRINKAAVALLGSYCYQFKYGIYFCWGNHEYMRDMQLIKDSIKNTPIKVLTNENDTLKIADKKLSIIGVDYPHDRSHFAELSDEYMKQAMCGVPIDSCKVLLAHHSDFIDNGFSNGIDLTLTGHTHGGQLGVFGHPLFPGFKYTRGMYTLGSMYGYVSTGAGSWFPFRLGCPPEITLFTLV